MGLVYLPSFPMDKSTVRPMDRMDFYKHPSFPPPRLLTARLHPAVALPGSIRVPSPERQGAVGRTGAWGKCCSVPAFDAGSM